VASLCWAMQKTPQRGPRPGLASSEVLAKDQPESPKAPARDTYQVRGLP